VFPQRRLDDFLLQCLVGLDGNRGAVRFGIEKLKVVPGRYIIPPGILAQVPILLRFPGILRLRVFENSYRVFDSYLEEIKEYDREMTTYYDLRNANRRVDSFSDQVVAKLNVAMPNRQGILEVIRRQGFKVQG
jgi:hypothetical protein